jgi:CelD/BcsL family acetyltransferase involved in cellulose biosynthesis
MADVILERIGGGLQLGDTSPTTRVPRDRASGLARPIAFTLIETIADFEALEEEWTELLARAGEPAHVFQGFAWNWHWTRHYLSKTGGRGPQLAIVTGRDDGRLVLVVPLVVSRLVGLRHLGWMGEPVSQYGDVIADPAVVDPVMVEAAFRFAAKATRSDLASLRKVRADALAAAPIARLGGLVTGTEEAPFMRLDTAADFEAYEGRHPPKRRKNRRRHQRRLEERGPVTFESHAHTEDAAKLAAYAVLLKRASLKTKGRISPVMADPRFAAFFADVARGRDRPVGCRVMALMCGGETAAMQIVLDHGAWRFLHISVFASKFEKCGVGGLLLEKALIDCFERRIDGFDLLAPKHEYKMEFADGSVQVHDHAVGFTLAGRAWVRGVLGLRQNAKRAIERLPAPVRRAVDAALSLARR